MMITHSRPATSKFVSPQLTLVVARNAQTNSYVIIANFKKGADIMNKEVAIRPAAGHSLQSYSSGNTFARAQWAGFGVISELRSS